MFQDFHDDEEGLMKIENIGSADVWSFSKLKIYFYSPEWWRLVFKSNVFDYQGYGQGLRTCLILPTMAIWIERGGQQ